MVACSVEPGTLVEAGSTIVVYIAADRDVQITATPDTPPEGAESQTESASDSAEPPAE